MIFTKEKSISAVPGCGTGEGVAHLKRWYVALVRMHHEKKVAERLSKMGIDTFVPVQQEVHQWSDRRKVVDTVLLPMMVFVHANLKERMEVLSFSTVSRYMVMRGESTPAVIPDEQMARFRFMLDYSDEAVCMNNSPLARGEKVRVIKGPLSGLVGELVTVGGKSKIAVRLNILGCACVDMPIGYVESTRISNDNTKNI
ncbi:UpxY family transcription antiterminator [Bacteroides acidifaciens]|uniref:UpxY family transcription antiterminator n=1 Tax=Bacteroides acidifaciens TaxID=85831 RepID=UPI00158A005F|nr:UpxY family transcription antiterminator [Bacteroides acidifaciens]